MVSPFEGFRQSRTSTPSEIPTEDDDVIQREAQKIRARAQLDQVAAQIGGPGTRVRDPNLFQQFLATAGQEFQQAFRSPELPPDAGIIDRLLPGFRQLSTPTLPEQVETLAPTALQPAARVVREVSSPLGLATLPLGGSARVVGGGLLGAAGGATAGQAIGGDTGELIGAIGGGVAGGIPAVQRLAGRGATAVGRGAVRGGDEAALRLQGGQVAHAATGQGRLSPAETEAAFARTRQAESAIPPSQGPQAATVAGTPDEPVSRLVGAIQNVKRLSPELRSDLAEKRRLELGTRVGVGMERAAGVAPSRKAGALRSALAGEQSRIPALEPVRGQFSPDDIESLYGRIWTSSLRDLEKGNASDALTRVLLPEGLDVPTPSEMTLLERVFGPDVRRALEDISKGRGRKIWEATVDVLNIPRALKSSFDISAVFRQGAILTVSHPQKAFGGRDSAFVRMLRSFRSPGAHEESLTRITSDPDFDLIAGAGRKNRLFIADAAETKITAREEGFASRWASTIHGIKGSQRAFNTYLNEMKWKTAKSYVDGLRKEGVDVTPDSQGLDTMTRFLNVATGRGKLGFLERRQLLQEMATTAFWSPRLTVSRFQVPVEGVRAVANLRSADPALRAASRQIAGDLVKYTGSVLSFLTFLKLSGLAEVEADPRSSDFGKIRVGGIRVDAWAGFQPAMRYTAQFITGQSKPITTGGIRSVPRDEVFGRFLRSKLSPGAVGLAATFLPEDTPLSGLSGGGRTFIGERIVPGTAKPYKTVPDRTTGLYGELLDEFAVPLIYTDINEAIRAEGLLPGLIFGAAPAVGFGVTTIPEEQGARKVPAGALR